MRYLNIDKCECVNGKEWGVSLYTAGCSRHCLGCFNRESWDFKCGQKYTEKTKNKILELIKLKFINRLTLVGGEPLEPCNLEDLVDLCAAVKLHKPTIKIWIYTGWTYEELQEREKNEPNLTAVLDAADVLVDGPFVIEEKDITLEFRGSTNQRILDLNKIRGSK